MFKEYYDIQISPTIFNVIHRLSNEPLWLTSNAQMSKDNSVWGMILTENKAGINTKERSGHEFSMVPDRQLIFLP